MNFLNPIFLIPIVTGPILILTGWILNRYPPKEINGLYGYRTKSAMKSQERWDFAQEFAAKEMMLLGFVLSLSCILGIFIELKETLGTAIGLGIMIIAFVALLVRTERAIKARFDS